LEVRENGDRKRGSNREQPFFAKMGKYAAIGLEFPSTVIGGMLLGYVLDLYFDTSPWFAILITLLAFLGACLRLVQLVKHFSHHDK
jgi:F0F1-type ATP synthase assembly protein I